MKLELNRCLHTYTVNRYCTIPSVFTFDSSSAFTLIPSLGACLFQVSAQERNNAVVIDTLEEELRVANEDKDHDIRLKNDVIRKLQVV